MNKQLPRYLLDKFQLLGQVTFSVLFAVVFMNLYVPFSPSAWFELGYSSRFLYTLLFFFLSIIVLVISRIVMYKTKYLFEMALCPLVHCRGRADMRDIHRNDGSDFRAPGGYDGV